MTTVVELVGKLPPKAKYNVFTTLYFESGKCVSDEWQCILQVDNHNDSDSPMFMDERHRHLEIRFRIEKVSTSFMSQKFRLQIQAVPLPPSSTDYAVPLPPASTDQILVAYTSAIESKAKPKRCNVKTRLYLKGPKRVNGDVDAIGSSKRRRRGIREFEDALNNATNVILQTQKRLASSEKTLALVVGRLEACVTQLNRMEPRQLSRPALMRFGSENSVKSFFDLAPSDLLLPKFEPTSKSRPSSSDLGLTRVPLERLSSKDWPSVWQGDAVVVSPALPTARPLLRPVPARPTVKAEADLSVKNEPSTSKAEPGAAVANEPSATKGDE